jgi:hypothetical protein
MGEVGRHFTQSDHDHVTNEADIHISQQDAQWTPSNKRRTRANDKPSSDCPTELSTMVIQLEL